MMKLRPLSLLLLPLLLLASCGTDVEFTDDDSSSAAVRNNTNRNDTRQSAVYGRLEFPSLTTHHSRNAEADVMIVHRASFGINYSVQWDTEKHAQRWSCYRMHAGNSSSKIDRKPRDTSGNFSEYPNDPDLPSQYHFTVDPYWSSGFDHGHMMPSADRAYSYNQAANRQTFYMTNMQPQLNSINAGIWADMETRIHGYGGISGWNNANFRDTLYIVKGGTIDRDADIIKYLGSGKNKIPVPRYFFMAILCKSKASGNGGYKALGFWVDQTASVPSNYVMSNYVRNIDELENLTGLDFFCNLPDDIEKAVESLPRDNVVRAWNLDK